MKPLLRLSFAALSIPFCGACAQSSAPTLVQTSALPAVTLATPSATSGATYFVSQDGSDGNDGRSPTKAWRHLTFAAGKIAAGDTVIVGAGTYDEPYSIYCDKAGDAAHITTWKAAPGTRPHVEARDFYGVFRVTAPYVRVEGFEISAPNAKGDDCGGLNADKGSHHVTFTNNIVHDVPGGGIGGVNCDYVTVENNTVYNCAYRSGYQTSGISFYEPVKFDDAPGFHFIIRGNRSYSNENKVPNPASKQITDGNGIIIDDFRWTQNKGTPYDKAVLIENNVSYNNGGRGIHVFYSDNVLIRNNTCFDNQRTPTLLGVAELSVFASKNTSFQNNIAFSREKGRTLYVQDADSSVVIDKNILWNGETYLNAYTGKLGRANKALDPQFVGAASGDFRLRPNSPALGAGANVGAVGASK